MEQNDGTPQSCGRGRPADNSLRRPRNCSTYAEIVTTEGSSNSNGMFAADSSWNSQTGEVPYFCSPSGDHPRSYDATPPMDKEKKPFQLSPFAKEFVPRNFKPELEAVDQTIVDSYPVQELRSFLSEITMSPGKFERKIQPLIDTFNSMADDDDTMKSIVNVIFDESIKQANLRYSGARLCKTLCTDLVSSPNHLSFKTALLNRCKLEFKRKEVVQPDDDCTNLRGFAMFMAELCSQLDVSSQNYSVLGDNLPKLIKTIISIPTADNLKCACQILKLVGAFLEDNERKNANETPDMDRIMSTLKDLAGNPQHTRSIHDMITSVIKLKESDWGRSSFNENSGYDTLPPLSVDEPVMYGPDGKPMTHDELMFLQSQYDCNLPLDADEYDVYDDNPGDEMPDEISEAYEVFLRENALRH